MKPTINPKGRPGMYRPEGRPDRSKAPLIKPQEEVKPVIKSTKKEAVTLAPLDPKEPYPQPEPSGIVTTNSYRNEITVEGNDDGWPKNFKPSKPTTESTDKKRRS